VGGVTKEGISYWSCCSY